ncbi:MAG: CoA-disulfide reductase [Devosia sp. 67-54]|uniref:FAD-dependent oxidoreductase n=1 Tax=unclassified Devosia TaxID=196773 RepID=UPI00086A4BA8|nr:MULTISPECIES: FAD-dependent oxidoreductase [unclassified Devosia]MBN9307507.1 FAD-dependent oxidoreductase [Devosia sp.]ODU55951.1 MAG: CoA-disulfide reductase [Acetobacteraceae bacterium SCN 69-10]OJX19884.1 MAG: CoA-disulfide reductase [Devosia sp. 67-54]
MPRLFIVGGSDAGISAALRTRELAPDWQVTMAVADRYPNFSICGIPFYLGGEIPNAQDLAHRKAADIEALGIEMLLDTRIDQVNAQGKRVHAAGVEHAFDKLVIGTGATSIRPPIAGLDLPGVFLLRWMDDMFAFERHLETRRPRRVTIVGAGYIGLEMAEAMTHRSVEVTVIELAPSAMTTIDPDLGTLVGQELERHGVRLFAGQAIAEIAAEGESLRLKGPNNFTHEADMVLVAAGAKPDTALAVAAGAQTGFKGAIKVNRRMETNLPDVYAAGDCVETFHRITQGVTYLPLGTTAHKQGRIAGENAIGRERLFEGSLGTQVVRVFDRVVARTGFHDRDARAAGFDPVSVDSTQWDHKVYYPGAKPMTIRVTADRNTGKLLGAQIVGSYGTEVSKRIDIFAAGIFHGMTIETFSDLDLSYTPPLSSPWDPVQMATQAWAKSERDAARSQ